MDGHSEMFKERGFDRLCQASNSLTLFLDSDQQHISTSEGIYKSRVS